VNSSTTVSSGHAVTFYQNIFTLLFTTGGNMSKCWC